MVYDDGTEVALWGVNLQTALYWEYLHRMKPCGIPLEPDALKRIVDQNLDELVRLNANVVRMHLLPSDFSDAEANLQDTIFLDVLDYRSLRCGRTRFRPRPNTSADPTTSISTALQRRPSVS